MNATESTVTQLDRESFDEFVSESGHPVLVDVSTEWCPPCRVMAPLVQQVAKQFAGQLKVGVVDSDEQMELARRLKINAIPTFFIYRNGEVVDRFQGIISREKLLEKLGLA